MAVYTTIHPGVKGFLSDWYYSLQRQTDQDFHLWIGLDSLDIDAVEAVIGDRVDATWVPGKAGDTPAQIRQRAWEQIVHLYESVVLVDSDDVLHPTRVAAARDALGSADVAGCALRLVDERGEDLQMVMQPPEGSEPADILPRYNIYGLSNSVYRSDVLRRCLPVPPEVVHVDWFLITRAWLCGAVIGFDRSVRMDYRQHTANLAQIQGPFTADRVLADAASVQQHFQILRAFPGPAAIPGRLALLERAAAEVDTFHEHMATHPRSLDCYVHALNALAPLPIWWLQVACPALRDLWTTSKEQE